MAQGGGGLDLGEAEIKVVISYEDALKGFTAFQKEFNNRLKGVGDGIFDASVEESFKAGRESGQNFAKGFQLSTQQIGRQISKSLNTKVDNPFRDIKSVDALLTVNPTTVQGYRQLKAAVDDMRETVSLTSPEFDRLTRQSIRLGQILENTAQIVKTQKEIEAEHVQRINDKTDALAKSEAKQKQTNDTTRKASDIAKKASNDVSSLAKRYADLAKVAQAAGRATGGLGKAIGGAVKKGAVDLSIVGSALAGDKESRIVLDQKLDIFRRLGREARTPIGALTRSLEGLGAVVGADFLNDASSKLAELSSLLNNNLLNFDQAGNGNLIGGALPDIFSGGYGAIDGIVQGLNSFIQSATNAAGLTDAIANGLGSIGSAGPEIAAATALFVVMEQQLQLVSRAIGKVQDGFAAIDVARNPSLAQLNEQIRVAREGLRGTGGLVNAKPGSTEEKEAIATIVSLEEQRTALLKAQERLSKQIAMNERERAEYIKTADNLSRVASNKSGPLLALPSTEQLTRQVKRDGRVFPQTIKGSIDFTNPMTVGNRYTPEGLRYFGGTAFDSLDNQLTNASRGYSKFLAAFLQAEDGFFDERISFFKKEEDRFQRDESKKKARRRSYIKALNANNDIDYENFLRATGGFGSERLDSIALNFDLLQEAEEERRREDQALARERKAQERSRRRRRSRARIDRIKKARLDAANKRSGAIQGALIGGGFPLLFGQSTGSAVGGGLGGFIGGLTAGQGGSFAGSIVGTALFTAFDAAADAAVALSKALRDPIRNLQTLADLRIIDEKDTRDIQALQGAGLTFAASAVAQSAITSAGLSTDETALNLDQYQRDRKILDARRGINIGKPIDQAINAVVDSYLTLFRSQEQLARDGLLITSDKNFEPKIEFNAGQDERSTFESFLRAAQKRDTRNLSGKDKRTSLAESVGISLEELNRLKSSDDSEGRAAFIRTVIENRPDLVSPDLLADFNKVQELRDQVADSLDSLERKTKIDIELLGTKDLEAQIKLLKELDASQKDLDIKNNNLLKGPELRIAQIKQELEAANRQQRLVELERQRLLNDEQFSINTSALSRQRFDLLAAQGKEDPSSFLQSQAIVRQFQQQKDNASLLAQVAGADPTNVEAGRRATEAAEALNNGYLQANLTLKKGLEDAERQAQKIGFSLTDAIGALGQAQNQFAQQSRFRTIDVDGGPSVFDANRTLREQAKRIAKETGTSIDFRDEGGPFRTERFVKRQNAELIERISSATALRNAIAGVDESTRNKQISDEAVENFQRAITSLNSEATPAMQALATSVDNLAQKEWRIDIQVDGKPRVIREGVY